MIMFTSKQILDKMKKIQRRIVKVTDNARDFCLKDETKTREARRTLMHRCNPYEVTSFCHCLYHDSKAEE